MITLTFQESDVRLIDAGDDSIALLCRDDESGITVIVPMTLDDLQYMVRQVAPTAEDLIVDLEQELADNAKRQERAL